MLIKRIIGSLVKELRTNVTAQGLNNRKDIGMTLSTESMDENGRAAAMSAIDNLETLVGDSVAFVLNHESYEGFKPTQAQFSAARDIARLAIDPAAGMQAIANARMPQTSQGAITLSTEEMGLLDTIDPGTLSTEAFDDQSVNNALYFSIAYNLGAARQDEWGEGFLPTMSIDPTKSGINITTEVTSLYKNFTRTTDGAANRTQFAKVTLAKAVYDNNVLGIDRNKVLPVVRTASLPVLLSALTTQDSSTGETFNTAPLLLGQEINLLGISQTDGMLAKGTMDAYDALDRTINMRSLIVSLTATIATVPVTEYFRIPIGMLPYSNFTYTAQGHEKDLGLSFDTTDVAFMTSTTVTWNGAASAILASLPIGHTVRMRVKLTGDGNTQHADIAVYPQILSATSVLDAAGNTLPTTSANYVAINTVFAGIVAEAYEVDAYLTNSNLRKEGQLVTIDRYEQGYAIPVRSGISVTSAINTNGDDDSRLIGQIHTTGYRMSLDAVSTVVSFTNNLGILTANGSNTNIGIMGIGRHHVTAYFRDAPFDLALNVDSESSSERLEDVRKAMLTEISDQLYVSFTESNYNVAHRLLHGPDADVGVILGTSSRLKNYLCGNEGDIIRIGGKFVVKVVETPNTDVGDVWFMTYSNHMASDRSTVIDPISFGQNVWGPTITTDVSTTINGAITRKFQTHPRYLHIVNLPIMMRTTVTNLTAVLGKVSRFTHAV